MRTVIENIVLEKSLRKKIDDFISGWPFEEPVDSKRFEKLLETLTTTNIPEIISYARSQTKFRRDKSAVRHMHSMGVLATGLLIEGIINLPQIYNFIPDQLEGLTSLATLGFFLVPVYFIASSINNNLKANSYFSFAEKLEEKILS